MTLFVYLDKYLNIISIVQIFMNECGKMLGEIIIDVWFGTTEILLTKINDYWTFAKNE